MHHHDWPNSSNGQRTVAVSRKRVQNSLLFGHRRQRTVRPPYGLLSAVQYTVCPRPCLRCLQVTILIVTHVLHAFVWHAFLLLCWALFENEKRTKNTF